MNIIEEVTEAQLKKDIPIFSSGDTIKVITKALEDKKGRKQSFEGVVIKRHGSGISKTFTLRKISYGVGVEKTFPLHSPTIEEIKVTHEEKSKRAKLYYLRKKKGKR
ncbi:50S ribosomal protein L19 [bacterium]|nr:50S ribosomal protein L19 [bacterium]MBU0900184.1 50S ribosomal protein L19 [bacterium]MBU1153473.1 50S ribosomal protein L19 [bacterium]MBU2599037.1 50S ribosomal protein L19 [bacterium]